VLCRALLVLSLSLFTLIQSATAQGSRSWDYLAADTLIQSRPSFQQCDKPQVTIGVLYATADLQFAVARDGRVDTTSVALIAARGASPEGFTSAARRYLITCRFRPGRAAGRPIGTLVLARLRFTRDSTVLMTSREAADSLLLPAVFEQPSAEIDRIYDNADSVLEEKPRLLPCGRNWGTFEVEQGADAHAAISGATEIEFVIGVDGRADRSTARTIRFINPLVARETMMSYMSCRYAPGRIRGEPVPVRVRVSQSF
jgi:hypothetical protein